MPIRAQAHLVGKLSITVKLRIVEPIFATIGVALILVITPILPYALAFVPAL